MHVIHSHNSRHLDEHTSRDVAFFITNKKGGYLSLGQRNFSQTQGLFFFDPLAWSPYKVIENIVVPNRTMLGIRNHLAEVERFYEHGTEETFTLFDNTLVYDIRHYNGEIEVELDFRHMYDFDDKGRIYSIMQEADGTIIVRYDKFSDHDLKSLQYTRYLAIRGASEFSIPNVWDLKVYPYDLKRGSKSEFYTYTALKIRVKHSLHLTFSFADTKEEALDASVQFFENNKYYTHVMKKYMAKTFSSRDLSFDVAMKALDDLLVTIEKPDGSVARTGLFAGLPWFFQFWSRDELLSLRALMIAKKYHRVKDIIFSYLDAIGDDGLLPNRLPHSEVKSIDAVGWLFVRIHDFLADLARDKMIEEFLTIAELIKIKSGLEKAILGLSRNKSKDGFIYGGLQESWMDTKEARRSGAFIESQAFLLAMMRLHNELAKVTRTKALFRSMEQDFAIRVRTLFLKNGELLDSIGGELPEDTQRPNVFLAHYVYPELLLPQDWKTVFDKALESLWLDWGGLSSIGSKNRLFQSEYTGEDDRSYHNGDSWYFVNNMAAIAMHRLDRRRYEKYIKRILHASREELLYSGFVGCSAEISSAKAMRSEGCLSQAWSAATYIELLHEIHGGVR
ncbi:hypothetical protein JW711_05360 [Candidatus Woesearchaeota archaeon]|nr:hypothetical protein [Candidatus Woesearchaeota archaeon]